MKLKTPEERPIRPPKNGLLKARCETDLENFYANLATFRQVDVADVVREALREYADRKKKDLCQVLTPS